MTRINAVAAGRGIPVIEDAAQCFGAIHQDIFRFRAMGCLDKDGLPVIIMKTVFCTGGINTT